MKKVITIAAMALLTGSFAHAKVIDRIKASSLKASTEQNNKANVKMKAHTDIKAKEQAKTKAVK